MTEILGSDDAYSSESRPGARPLGPAEPPYESAPVELLDDGLEDDPAPAPPARWRGVLASVTEPASLAIAAVLSVVTSLTIGPSYRYDTYPFNQGITSLRALFGNAVQGIHPLREYLSSVSGSAVLVVTGLVTAALSLLRARAEQPAWVRAAAAGALLVSLVLAALIVVGAWRSSTFDVQVPGNTISGTAG